MRMPRAPGCVSPDARPRSSGRYGASEPALRRLPLARAAHPRRTPGVPPAVRRVRRAGHGGRDGRGAAAAARGRQRVRAAQEPSGRALLRRPSSPATSPRRWRSGRAWPSRAARASWTSTAAVRSTRSPAAAWAPPCCQKPARIARLVEAMRGAVERAGDRQASHAVIGKASRTCRRWRGPARRRARRLTIHGRSREQRYNRAADWDLIGRVAAERRIPVVGNGDILTHYEAGEPAGSLGCRAR